MLRPPSVSLPILEPLALLDATLLFLVQVLIARHPNLLAPPEAPTLHQVPGDRAARRVVDAIREVHHALESYGVLGEPCAANHRHDDLPF